MSIEIMLIINNAIDSGQNRDCWKYSGTPLVVQSQLKSHVILAAMGFYEESNDCKTGTSHIIHIKLDGYQDWIDSQAYMLSP